MKKSLQWDLFFKNHQYPCFITEKDSVQLLYFNSKFSDVFQVNDEVIGKKFYDIFLPQDVQLDKLPPDWNQVEFYETTCYNKKNNANFLLRSTRLDEYNVIFAEMLPCDEITTSTQKYEEALSHCMDIYTQQMGNVSFSLMEFLCEFYDSEVAYVYRYDEEHEQLFCIARWTEKLEEQVKDEVVSPFNGASLMKILIEENEAGILIADASKPDLDPTSVIALVMKSVNVNNMTLCTVEDNHQKVVGMVGISNRRNMQVPLERRLLTTISRFVFEDVTRGVINQTLFHLHHRDPLTGLYNRNSYAKKIDQMLADNPTSLGVIVVNVNGLKFINERAGISGGDEHIKRSAKRVKEYFGFDAFRMSGDEIILIAPNVEEKQFEAKVIELHTQMKKEDNYDFSFGHAWGGKGFEIGKLQYEADAVMYINKQEYYSTSKREFDAVKDTTLSDLLSYLKNEEFMIYLQPQVKLEDGLLHGAEALIRRFDKTNNKMVFPDQFIPLYEQKSVIRHVDMFVIEEVCKLIKEWEKAGQAIPVSVNLSRVTLLEYGIVKVIADICNKYEIDRQFLVIEVTERVGLIENNVASSLIVDFINHGFRISLDDFGCAYSNIVTLAQIDVDEVKLDKSLVDNLTISLKNKVLVRNVLNMCRELENTSTLAEGIEDKEQADLLHTLGCHLGQGYYYSRPIPVGEFCEKYKKTFNAGGETK